MFKSPVHKPQIVEIKSSLEIEHLEIPQKTNLDRLIQMQTLVNQTHEISKFDLAIYVQRIPKSRLFTMICPCLSVGVEDASLRPISESSIGFFGFCFCFLKIDLVFQT